MRIGEFQFGDNDIWMSIMKPNCDEQGSMDGPLGPCQRLDSIFSITNNNERPATLTLSGGVNDEVIINGEVYEPGAHGFPWGSFDNPCGSVDGDNGAHNFTYTTVLAPQETITIGAKDNGFGGGYGLSWSLVCD